MLQVLIQYWRKIVRRVEICWNGLRFYRIICLLMLIYCLKISILRIKTGQLESRNEFLSEGLFAPIWSIGASGGYFPKPRRNTIPLLNPITLQSNITFWVYITDLFSCRKILWRIKNLCGRFCNYFLKESNVISKATHSQRVKLEGAS